jgi:hypothetical protein
MTMTRTMAKTITMMMMMMMTMMMMMMVVMVVVGGGRGGPPLSREKSRDVLEQPPEYLLKQEDSS